MAFHLAQLNIARLLHPLDHPQIKEFVDGLDHINALAEQWPGFVWRLQTDSDTATDVHHPWWQDPFALANMSVWESPEPQSVLREFRLERSRAHGASPRAFWFGKLFPAPAVSAAPV